MMKKRKGITKKVRDGWIEQWELDNSQSPLYFSFIKTQDIKSYGSKARVPDFCDDSQDRNLLSTNERLFFYRLRFSKRFVWIKEQYPLLPLARAMAVAKELKLKYPTYPYTSNIEVVMTSDFYCQDFTGQQYVYSIKDEKQFKKATERQKRNIEEKLKIDQSSPNNPFATGGIATKLKAADFLMNKGKSMLLCNGFDLTSAESFLLHDDHQLGTLFKPLEK